MNIELDYIKSLVKLVNENELTELKIISKDDKIVIKKEKEVHVAPSVVSAPVTQSLASQPEAQAVAEAAGPVEEVTGPVPKPAAEAKRGTPVVSPMVGTFYRSPSPGSPSFVEVGSKVKVGQVLCIIESMKLMNEIESEVSGTVVEICAENSDAVEAGTVLMYIE